MRRLFENLGWEVVALIVALSVLIWGIFRIRSWYREDDDPDALHQEMLWQIRDLQRQGDLSEQEYRSIKSQIQNRMDPTDGSPDKGRRGD